MEGRDDLFGEALELVQHLVGGAEGAEDELGAAPGDCTARSWRRRSRGAEGDGGESRTWLLIKHRDEWSGELDIAEFAPRSVKSDGGFEDILAEDTPAVWLSNRPAKGGDAGAMLAEIIERAARLKAERAEGRKPDRRAGQERSARGTQRTRRNSR